MKEKPEAVGIALLRGLDKEENTLSRPSHSHSALRWQLAIHPLIWADLICAVCLQLSSVRLWREESGSNAELLGPPHTESSSH